MYHYCGGSTSIYRPLPYLYRSLQYCFCFQILSAFQEMGMHEANNIALTHLALLCYEAFRPCFPDIVMVFQQVDALLQHTRKLGDYGLYVSLVPKVLLLSIVFLFVGLTILRTFPEFGWFIKFLTTN